jgi:hypothetical protein
VLARAPEPMTLHAHFAPAPSNNALIYPLSIVAHPVGTQPVGRPDSLVYRQERLPMACIV